MSDRLNILKLCVGADSVEDLTSWQASQAHRWPKGRAVHVTRMWPKREPEILGGGSLYWVIKGVILARQPILAMERVEGADGILRCALVLDAAVIRTEPAPRRPFQGWRYLAASDCPRDLPAQRDSDTALPAGLAAALADIGLR
ncbi:MAG: DUF1489 domain-containing protein [Gemmobacter sp.]|nr:DUF1489 domain-containing protein [Gemmobacter sp.]